MDKVEEQNTDEILHCWTCGSEAVERRKNHTDNFVISDSQSVNIAEVLMEVLDVIKVRG